MKLKKSLEKFGMFILAVSFLVLVTFSHIAFAIPHHYLRQEADYLISSILANWSQVCLIIVTAIISLFAFLPVLNRGKGYLSGLRVSVVLAVIIGFIFGVLKAIIFILSNKYAHYGMYYLISYSVSSIVTGYLLMALGTAIFVFLVLISVYGFLRVIRAREDFSAVIVSGFIPALLLFAIGGYWLNKQFLPELLATESIVGNAVWAFLCLVIGWPLGWAILKMSRQNLDLSKIYALKTAVGIAMLVILFNLGNFFYQSSLKTGRPNIILISIDTLRADHLGSYGYNRETTPNIDRFAEDGVLFSNTIVQAPWTLPSHMSLLTGLYPSTHGVMSPNHKLNDSQLTVAEILQNNGYETVAFTDGAYLSREFGYQGFDRFDDTGNGIEAIYSKAVAWLKKSHNRSFFLFLHTYQVHAPFDPPSDYDLFSDKSYQGIVKVSGNGNDYYRSIKPRMTLDDYIYVIDKYDGEIYYTDHFLGKLFGMLKDSGIYDDSIIIVTSDHGENFLDHPNNDIDHKELYDEIVKVPLIISAPGFPKGKIIDTQVESIDIMPTALQLTGVRIPNRVDGESLVDVVESGSQHRPFAFSERSNVHKMIRDNNWKLIHRSEIELELFDLKNDPDEQHNLMAEKTEIAKSLYQKLDAWIYIQNEKSKLLTAEKIELDGDLTEKLKALGYLN